MSKRTASLLLIASLLVAALFGRSSVSIVLGQDPTIPTRTPTPDPNAPTATKDAPVATATDSGGNPPPTQPSATVPPVAGTATATLPGATVGTATATVDPGASATPTTTGPETGDAPVPAGCDDTPFVQAIDQTSVFAGPGADYAAVAILLKDETRPIIGRAEFAPWWQILVTETLIGWVFDEAVNEFGNTGRVPLAQAPEINGATPTPGLPWNPTPLPFACTVTPTPTPTSTATATASSTATPTPASAEETAAAATVAAVMLESEDGGGTGRLPGSGDDLSGKQLQDASAAATSPSNFILPLAGIGLIGAGILVALLARTRGAAGPGKESPEQGQ